MSESVEVCVCMWVCVCGWLSVFWLLWFLSNDSSWNISQLFISTHTYIELLLSSSSSPWVL